MRLDHLAELFNVQQAAVVGQRVDEDCRVLAGLDDLVEVADAAELDRPGEGAVDPTSARGLQQVAANQVASREVLVTRHGD